MDSFMNFRVRHNIYGEGIVVDQKHHGHEYLIRFSNNLKLWLRKNSISILEGYAPLNSEALTSEMPPPVSLDLDTDFKDGRSVIEAFRLGIVPVQSIRDWTIGREMELDTIKDWLNDESSGTLVIKGEYGSGKSHLIEYLHSSGFDLNYAVSLVGIDPSDAQPGFPKRVYRHIMRNIRFPHKNQYLDFCEMMTYIGRGDNKRIPLSKNPFIGEIFRKIKQDEDTPQMWDWIVGQDTPFSELGTLYDHTTAANIYCNILSSIGMLAVKALGLKGVLLMFDEAETSRTYRYAYEWNRAVNFFNALSMVANDEPALKGEKIVKGNNCYYGNKTGLIYSGHLKIPYIQQFPSFLKVVFAFTPDYKLELYQDYNIYEIELSPLPPQQKELLFSQFADLYESVYRLPIPHTYRRKLLRGIKGLAPYSTRKFIKAMVESLDFYRFYPKDNPEALFANGFSNVSVVA